MEAAFTPEQSLIDTLQTCSIEGTFEAHVTVAAESLAQREQFRSLCSQLDVKCVLIELPEGTARSQPMTSSYHHNSLAEVLPEIIEICRKIRAAGFAIARLKLEAVAHNHGVPEEDEAARTFPASNYFEFHAKLLLGEQTDLACLHDLCAHYQARLSGNALKHRSDGMVERFVTMRVYSAGRRRAFGLFEQLLATLAVAGYDVVHQLREYTIFDSAVALDGGWIAIPSESVE